MNDYVINVKLAEINKSISDIKEDLDYLIITIKPDDDELWDNSQIIRKWKISERTLASWRCNSLISYVQVNGKIWYSRQAREEFLNRNLIQIKNV